MGSVFHTSDLISNWTFKVNDHSLNWKHLVNGTSTIQQPEENRRKCLFIEYNTNGSLS